MQVARDLSQAIEDARQEVEAVQQAMEDRTPATKRKRLSLQRRKAVQDVFKQARGGRATGRSEVLNEKLEALVDGMADIDSHRDRYLSMDMQQAIVRVHMHTLHKRLLRRKKQKVRHGIRHEDPQVETAKVLGVSPASVQRCWHAYCTGKMLIGYKASTAKAVAKAAKDRARIPSTQGVVDRVRAFVRSLHREHRKCTAVEVTQHLLESGDIDGKARDPLTLTKKEMDAALRCVQRWLSAHGWTRGKHNAKTKMKETAQLRQARAEYLAVVQRNRKGEKLREVFTDETYIHQHYHSDDRTVYDPSDESDLGMKKHSVKGDGFNVVGVMLGPDLHKEEEEREDTLQDKGGWYPKAYAKFQAPLRRKKDYHACFTAAGYEKWFEGVCKLLADDGYKCLFIMDNVAYHKATHFNTLKKLRKEDLFTVLKNGTAARGGDPARWDRFSTKSAVTQHLQTLSSLMDPRVALIAKKYGHKVAYTPSYHSDLQPIETVWAIAKGAVARQYHHSDTMQQTLERLDAAFAAITPAQVYDCYKKALRCEDKARAMVEEAEAEEDEEGDDGSEDVDDAAAV